MTAQTDYADANARYLWAINASTRRGSSRTTAAERADIGSAARALVAAASAVEAESGVNPLDVL